MSESRRKGEWAVCVYCASGPVHPELLALAAEVGEAIADRGGFAVRSLTDASDGEEIRRSKQRHAVFERQALVRAKFPVDVGQPCCADA